MKRGGGDAGFTLLEVMVALAVLGFLVLGLNQGTRFGLAAWDQQSRMLARGGELDAVDRSFRSIVAHLVPRDDPNRPGLRGGPTTLDAVTDLPLEGGQRAQVGLGMDRQGRLVLRWVPFVHARPLRPPPPAAEVELLRGVQQFHLAYWSPAEAAWHDSWTRRELPGLVRLRLVFPPGDPRRWPDIIAAPGRNLPQRAPG